jgi:septal ring factor EnvC (AmiA/AmiB activator)
MTTRASGPAVAPTTRRGWPGLLAALLLLTLAIGRADAQQAERARLGEARAEEQRLAAERVAAAARLRGLEETTLAAANRVAALAERQRAAEARLEQRGAELAPMLPVVERMALYPAETLLAVPLSPEQSVRGLLVLGAIGRQLEADAAAVREGQAEAARLRRETEAELPALAAAEQAQAHAAASLDADIARAQADRRAAEDALAQAIRQAAAEAAQAATLRAALARLEAARKAQEAAARHHPQALASPAGPDLGAPGGRLTAPVGGAVSRGWGQPGDAGPTNGVTYAAAPGARVVSPCTGRVVFASPFRSYGLLLIVDCGAGWHAVLAGMARLDAEPGQTVREGEPVGVMAAWSPAAGGRPPGLYLELRKAGRPVDPTPLLRAKG